MQEEYKYFVSYVVNMDNIFDNDEVIFKLIESKDDIDNLEHLLWQRHNKECKIINYRMF